MRRRLTLLALVMAVLTACANPDTIPADQVFPSTVGTFLRTAGPFNDAVTGAEVARYAGQEGDITLNVRFVGEENVAYALSELPVGASDITEQPPEMGPRRGVTFTYAEAYHAAWGNGDWVFVINAATPDARRAFLAGYGF